MKRLIDFGGALVGLVVLSPFLALFWLAVVAESGLPGLFRQRRMGLGGQDFVLFKFRTMTTLRGAEQGSFDAGSSVRVTRVGRFLRKTKLDELPQLWNVLKGEMSLVGPRPERPEMIQTIEQDVAGYARRHELPPGITGFAQINGRYETDAAFKLGYDLQYLVNWSIVLDIQILLRTVWVVVSRRV